MSFLKKLRFQPKAAAIVGCEAGEEYQPRP
jgi:hypothetical protein